MTLPSTPLLPQAAVVAITKDVRVYGLCELETGGFLLLPGDADIVSLVALAGDQGITRRRDRFQISERALDRLLTFADDRDLWVPIQFHSHEAGAFLSPIDADHGLRVEGFTSVVVPAYRDPPGNLDRWGWWRFTAGHWARANGARVADGAVELVRFDEAGVHDG
jgi:hypothetical protein